MPPRRSDARIMVINTSCLHDAVRPACTAWLETLPPNVHVFLAGPDRTLRALSYPSQSRFY